MCLPHKQGCLIVHPQGTLGGPLPRTDPMAPRPSLRRAFPWVTVVCPSRWLATSLPPGTRSLRRTQQPVVSSTRLRGLVRMHTLCPLWAPTLPAPSGGSEKSRECPPPPPLHPSPILPKALNCTRVYFLSCTWVGRAWADVLVSVSVSVLSTLLPCFAQSICSPSHGALHLLLHLPQLRWHQHCNAAQWPLRVPAP